MIILKATTETLRIVTTTNADIDYSVSYADITATAFSPSTAEGKITTATSATMVTAPAALTQRQLKLITITNRHATASNTIVVRKDISGTDYSLSPIVTLLAGETLQYMDAKGWVYYSSTGAIKNDQRAAGATGQIQYNTDGILAGDPDLTWDSTNNELVLGGNDTNILMRGVTNEPSLPSAGTLHIYSKAITGKMQLKMKGPSGLDTPLQAVLWQNNTFLWTPGIASGTFMGGTGSTSPATGTIAYPTSTNLYTAMRRSTFGSVVTTTNQQVGIRSESMFYRGNAAGMGGFMFVCRFGFTSIKTGMRAFVGLCQDTTAIVNADPASKFNTLGFGFDTTDTAWYFIHNDGAGTAIKETINGQGTLATNNTGYDAYIWCAPNSSTVYYQLDRTDTGATIANSSVSMKLPLSTQVLCAQCVMSNGTANTVALDANIGINRMYVETDR